MRTGRCILKVGPWRGESTGRCSRDLFGMICLIIFAVVLIIFDGIWSISVIICVCFSTFLSFKRFGRLFVEKGFPQDPGGAIKPERLATESILKVW